MCMLEINDSFRSVQRVWQLTPIINVCVKNEDDDTYSMVLFQQIEKLHLCHYQVYAGN